MSDPRFHKSVIFMIEHDESGAMGLIINKTIGQLRAEDLVDKKSLEDVDRDSSLQLYFGGPVEIDKPFLIHSTDVMLESSVRIQDGIALSVDPEIVKRIAEKRGPKSYILALGYAGWAPGQLEGELQQGAWIVLDAEPGILFSENPEKTWEILMEGKVFRL